MDRRIDDVRPAQKLEWEGAGELPVERRVAERRAPVAAALPASDDLRKTVNAHCNDLLDCAAVLHDDGRFKDTAAEIRVAVAELRAAMKSDAPAPALPVVPEGQRLVLTKLDRFSLNRKTLGLMDRSAIGKYCRFSDVEAMLAAAPTPPVEQPSQPQDQSGSIRPSAEPASQLDAPGGVDLDKLEALAKDAEQMFTGVHWYTRFQILDGISNDESAALIGALDPDTVLKLITLARKVDQSNIAEPDTAAQAPSESIDSLEFSHLLVRWHLAEPGEDAKDVYDDIVAHIHSWHQRATQAAKPLTDERLEEIAASWDGCTYEAPGEVVDIGQDLRRAFKRTTQSHLKGE